jgi:hypothetical protein
MHDSECDNGSSEHAEPYPANHASARWRIRAAGATRCGLRMVKVAESSWLAVAQRMLMQLEADEREAFVAVLRQRGLSGEDFEVIIGSLTVTPPAMQSVGQALQYGPWTEVVVVRSRHTGAEGR